MPRLHTSNRPICDPRFVHYGAWVQARTEGGAFPRRLGRVHQRDAKTRCLQSCGRSTELSALPVGSSTICAGCTGRWHAAPPVAGKKYGVERPRRYLDVQRLGRFAAWNARSIRSASGGPAVPPQSSPRARWSTELADINVHVWPWRRCCGRLMCLMTTVAVFGKTIMGLACRQINLLIASNRSSNEQVRICRG